MRSYLPQPTRHNADASGSQSFLASQPERGTGQRWARSGRPSSRQHGTRQTRSGLDGHGANAAPAPHGSGGLRLDRAQARDHLAVERHHAGATLGLCAFLLTRGVAAGGWGWRPGSGHGGRGAQRGTVARGSREGVGLRRAAPES